MNLMSADFPQEEEVLLTLREDAFTVWRKVYDQLLSRGIRMTRQSRDAGKSFAKVNN